MNNKKQIQMIAIILVAVIALSVGFAAFSATLTIESQANVNPNASDFSVKFSRLENTLDESDVIATNIVGDGVEARDAKIDNSSAPTITDLNVSFTRPGESVTYEFYVMNTGLYDAYLRDVEFKRSVNGVDFISCKAGEGATNELVQEACQGINFELTIDGQRYTEDGAFVVQELAKRASKKVTVKISYETGSTLADGPFTVDIGDVALTYASTSTGEYDTPEIGGGVETTDESCFISTTPGELSFYVCDGNELDLSTDIPTKLSLSRVTDVVYNEEKCYNMAILESGDESAALEFCENTFKPIFDELSLSEEEKNNPEILLDFLPFSDIIFESIESDTYQITEIGAGLFYGSRIEGELIITNNITSIGLYAFVGNNLTSVTLPNSVETIGDYAFSNNNLSSVVIPDSVKTIGGYAFHSNQISNLTLGNNVTMIKEYAFASNFLTDVVIPDSITTMEYRIFANNNLTTVEIGAGMTNFDSEIFNSKGDEEGYGRNAITSVSIKEPKSNVSISSSSVFEWASGSNCATWTGDIKDNPCIDWVNG